MKVGFNVKGNFSKTEAFFEKKLDSVNRIDFKKYGEKGVAALKEYTPKDTGLTSESWGYEIVKNNGLVSITFKNSNVSKGFSVAILLQYGHGTRNGGWFEGVDYINPALRPIFKQLVKDACEEVTAN